MPNMVSAKHRSPVGGGCVYSSLPPARTCARVHCETRVASCGRTNASGLTENERQELLWQDFCLDSSQWWDNWQRKKSSRHPDFRHKTSKGVLWIDNLHKPAWVDLQLSTWDGGMGGLAGFKSTSGEGNYAGHCREARNEDSVVVGTLNEGREVGELSKAVEELDLLVQRGCHISESIFYYFLKRCTTQRDLALGRRVHALALRNGYESNAFLANHVIGMYAVHGRLEEARQVFSIVAAPTAYMWCSIILAHARHGQPTEAINLYRTMRESSVIPDNHIFVAVLKACAKAEDLVSGKEVHADIMGSAVRADIVVDNSLVDMYAKCGSLDDARRVFDRLPTRDVVTWTAMIAGYAKHGMGQEALDMYAQMQQGGMTAANHVTFVCLLHACASVGALNEGKKLHSQIDERGLNGNVFIGSCLVDMYAKCGSVEDARRVFDTLPRKNVVTWTTMLAGYAQRGLGEEALALYSSMQVDATTTVDSVTFVCLLQACSSVGALQQGKQIHAQIQKSGLQGDLLVGNCLVDMYAKCGRLEDARKVFQAMHKRDVVTWNSLLNGYAEHGCGQMAIQCFEDMRNQGVEPNDTTFICLLVACSHAGLVHEGRQYFKMMVEDHGIEPKDQHHGCMVDLLGRSGCLDEAESILQTVAFENEFVGWKSLLSACKSHGDVERGRRCFDRLTRLEPGNASSYVLLANIYANAGKWKDVERIESLRKAVGADKKPAKACIELYNKVHVFTVGDEESDVSSKVRRISKQVKEGGHVPQTQLVLKAVSEQEKEDSLCGHAEKLALAYGLINTPDGTTLLVTKSLRMCNDCHSSTKIMSSLERREIVVRDTHRVHHFLNGSCSCGDRH